MPFGGKSFVEAYSLRAKCNLKILELDNALYDSNVAIKYGGVNFEQILIKSIALYSLNRYQELKDFILQEAVSSVTVVEDIEDEMKQLGFSFTFEYLKKFANSEVEPEAKIPELNDKLTKVVNFKMNYTIDSRVEIVVEKHKGRYMKAKELIPMGTTILAERSFSIVFDSHVRHEYCLYCFARCVGQCIPCRYCVDAVFCNEDCFENAWKLFHQHECLLLSVFNDPNVSSEHMFRTLSRIGLSNAIAICEKFDRLKVNPEVVSKSVLEEKSVARVINDSIIEFYLNNETLRLVPSHQQSEEQRSQVYEMHCTLLDHNDMFEAFYDVSYMPVAINVAILLLLSEHLQKQTNLPCRYRLIDFDEIEQMLEVIQLEENIEQCKVFGASFSTFVKLVEILLINIRKMCTNVFSWRQLNGSRKKRQVAACQILVGSFVNHSCDPNVGWIFQNGCAVYTSLR